MFMVSLGTNHVKVAPLEVAKLYFVRFSTTAAVVDLL